MIKIIHVLYILGLLQSSDKVSFTPQVWKTLKEDDDVKVRKDIHVTDSSKMLVSTKGDVSEAPSLTKDVRYDLKDSSLYDQNHP